MREHFYGGIDVSKDRLDVMVLPDWKSFSVDNDAAGYSELVKRLRDLPIAAIGIEPSGGYERAFIRALLAAGLSVRRINPNKLRQFARARGILAKNDRLDARLIAEYVAIMPTRVVQRDPATEQLAEVVPMRHHAATRLRRACRGRKPDRPPRGCHVAAPQQTSPGAARGRYPSARQTHGSDHCQECQSHSAL